MELNKIYNENCLDTMARMPDNFLDLTVTSPPYDNLRKYNGYSFPFEEIAKELFRVTKEGGVVVWNVNDSTINGSESLISYKQAIYFVEQAGFLLNDTMIYKKKNPLPISSGCRYNPSFEFIFCFSKGKPNAFNPILLDKTWKEVRITKNYSKDSSGVKKTGTVSKSDKKLHPNVFEYKVGGGHVTCDKIAYKHPAIMPEQLAYDNIYTWSNEGDIVYDCFSGSGTTAKMAHLLNRQWLGSELSAEYVEIAYKRLTPYIQQTEIFKQSA